jgi:hypothetical protein
MDVEKQLTFAHEMEMLAAELEDLERASRPVYDADEGWRFEALDAYWRECDDLRWFSVQF